LPEGKIGIKKFFKLSYINYFVSLYDEMQSYAKKLAYVMQWSLDLD